MFRHCLDAVDARAQVHTIEIQLEDLRFLQLRFDQQRNRRLFHFAAVASNVREKQRSRELLRQRAAAFDAPARTHIADGGTDETDRIDAGVTIEPPILDRDDRVLKVGRDVGQQHIVALLVEAEPLPAVGAVEHRVADAAREPVDDDGVARQPHGRQRPEDDQRAEQYGRGPLGPAAGAQ